MRRTFIFLAGVLSLMFCGCSVENKNDRKDVVVEVNGAVLTRRQLDEAIGTGRPAADSARLAQNYITNWIEEELLFDKANRNIQDQAEIDRLVNQYKRQLVIFEYQKQLIGERMGEEISEEDLQAFYQTHRKRYTLAKPVVKGIFLKLPANAPQLSEVKKWMKNVNPETLEKIEKYSLQNAMAYDYFLDRWVSFDDLMDNIPYQIANANRFLKENKVLEVTEGDYWYYLSVQEYVSAGSPQPFDYARPHMIEAIVNQKKKSFIRNLGNDLYKKAVQDNKVKFYTEPAALN